MAWFYRFTKDGILEESERQIKKEGPFFEEGYGEYYLEYIEQPNKRTNHKIWRRLHTAEGEVTHLYSLWLEHRDRKKAIKLLIDNEKRIVYDIEKELEFRKLRIKKLNKMYREKT